MRRVRGLEELLAALLRYGSWSASVAIGLGFALALIGSHTAARIPSIVPHRIATVGIALFILLPVLRVLLMLLVFICERDFRLASIAGLVLVIILLGIVLGFPGVWGVTGHFALETHTKEIAAAIRDFFVPGV